MASPFPKELSARSTSWRTTVGYFEKPYICLQRRRLKLGFGGSVGRERSSLMQRRLRSLSAEQDDHHQALRWARKAAEAALPLIRRFLSSETGRRLHQGVNGAATMEEKIPLRHREGSLF